MTSQHFSSFKEFYPYYLSEHSHPMTRKLHFLGVTLALLVLILTFVTRKWILFLLLPVVGYSFAWVGHFFFEKNRPATFQYPFYSLLGDFVMFRDILLGKIK